MIRLGAVTCPSGRLVIADTGYLGLWSGDREPVAGEAVLSRVSDAMRGSIRASADLAAVGPDAGRAARSFDRQPGTWIYDVPGHAIEQTIADFADHCAAHRLDARLTREPARVSHRERVERCARDGGSFLMFGVPVAAIGGLPADQEFPVVGTARGDGWESVALAVREGETASSTLLGHIGVDAARMSLIDADALASWRHDDPIDGLADVAFWGRDVRAAAKRFKAPPLAEEGVHGWTDLPVAEAVRRGSAIEEWKRDRGLMVDFRPHSHHWRVMAQVRAAETASGTIEVGGSRTTCFMTGRGDGHFPVHADRDRNGDLLRIRIHLGA
ncbi:hypothetical protein [Spirillospora sp. CA-294931]|uniref:hypothetical protein n=1 Tax=Spirillospora sp. CA-294931 TaxID=3240042 RepID=UPI003D8A359D